MPLGLLGAGVSAYANYKGAQKQNEASERIADKQMAFQERMSSTAHRREQYDLKKAGLNPMLAVMKGGASSSAGASYQPQSELGAAASGARDASLIGAQLKQMNANTALTNAQKDAVVADTPKRQFYGTVFGKGNQYLTPLMSETEDLMKKLGPVAVQHGKKIKKGAEAHGPALIRKILENMLNVPYPLRKKSK